MIIKLEETIKNGINECWWTFKDVFCYCAKVCDISDDCCNPKKDMYGCYNHNDMGKWRCSYLMREIIIYYKSNW